MIRGLLFILFVVSGFTASAQQMVVIKKGKISVRYNLGDEIRFTLKDEPKQVHHAAILSIREFEFLTLQKDTIKYSDIARLKFKNKNLKKYVVSTLIGSGVLLGLHFVLKEPFGEKNPIAVKGLAYAAGSGIIPIFFALIANKSQMKLNGYRRLKFVNYDSPLYK
jgi:hypothetical protein